MCMFACECKSIGICCLVLTVSCSMNVQELPLSAYESYEVYVSEDPPLQRADFGDGDTVKGTRYQPSISRKLDDPFAVHIFSVISPQD